VQTSIATLLSNIIVMYIGHSEPQW